MSEKLVPCPQVGHKQFQNSLKFIQIGDVDTPHQISKFVRAHSCIYDGSLEIPYEPGVLQQADLRSAMAMFAYERFIAKTFLENRNLFRHSQCRIYQFQTTPRLGPTFIFGLFITDGSHNLVDFCLDTRQAHKRRAVITKLIRTICTPESVFKKFSH